MILKYLNSLLISSIVIFIISLIYFGLRKWKILKLKIDYKSFDSFFKKLLIISSVVLIGYIVYIIPKTIKNNKEQKQLAQDIAKQVDTAYVLANDTTLILGHLEIFVPRKFKITPINLSEENTDMLLFHYDTADISLGFMVLYKYPKKKIDFRSFVTSLTNEIIKSSENKYKFSNSNLRCDYSPCDIKDYVRIDKNNNRVHGTMVFMKWYNDFYYVNFFNSGENYEYFEKLKTKLYYSMIFK